MILYKVVHILEILSMNIMVLVKHLLIGIIQVYVYILHLHFIMNLQLQNNVAKNND